MAAEAGAGDMGAARVAGEGGLNPPRHFRLPGERTEPTAGDAGVVPESDGSPGSSGGGSDPPVAPARSRRVWRVLAFLLALAAALLLALYFVVRLLVAPMPGEWTTELRLGPLQLQAGVPTLIRLATAPWLAPLLDGRTLATSRGPVAMAWQATGELLQLRCAPCAVQPPGLGGEPLVVDEVRLTAQRRGNRMNGTVASGKVQARWQGNFVNGGLGLSMQLPLTPMADAYQLFRTSIPELAQARIEGTLALSATLALPGGAFSVMPQIEAFQVSGLGTEALVNARSACSEAASRLTPDSWLARAVVAAEDQRFYQHGGYDLVELGAALSGNHGAVSPPDAGAAGHTLRGASTLGQQLAKMVVTGDERSPTRKLRELLYAVEMEQTLGKNRILLRYLAHAPWGSGVCGAEAASRRYFRRPAHQLDPAQAAWLAAMLHNPNQEAEHWAAIGQINLKRTQWVLQGMRALPRQQRLRLAEQLGTPGKPAWKMPDAKP